MTTATLTRDSKTAPAEAFRFSLPVQFKDSVGDEKATPTTHRVSIDARTAGVVNHWYWGRIVHDMSGMQSKDRVPLDWRHREEEILGYADSIKAGNDGLKVSGLIQSIKEGDRSSEIIARGRLGQPYESSIYWDDESAVLEYLDDGWVTEVNGQQVEGPCVIAREWTLRGIAITPYGVDPTTKTQFSAQSSAEVPLRLQPAKDAMSKETPTAPAADTKDPTKDSATPASNPPASTETKPTAAADPHKDAARGELARFMTRFGNDRGAEYFRDSVPYEQACERELEHLQKTLATKDSELVAERQKIASLGTGEDKPVDTGATKDSAKPTGWASHFKKAGT